MNENQDVRHYLEIYTTRKDMQEEGVTNPPEQIKKFTNDFVENCRVYLWMMKSF